MQEKLSAMMDGEWDDRELERLIAAIDEDEACADRWREYHLISDALNAQPAMSHDFMARFSERLEAEPVVLAPRALEAHVGMARRRRWVAFSVAASVALVGATAWYVAQPVPGVAAPQYVAANPPVAPVDSEPNPYLVAHQDMLGNPGFSHRAVILTEADAERPAAH